MPLAPGGPIVNVIIIIIIEQQYFIDILRTFQVYASSVSPVYLKKKYVPLRGLQSFSCLVKTLGVSLIWSLIPFYGQYHQQRHKSVHHLMPCKTAQPVRSINSIWFNCLWFIHPKSPPFQKSTRWPHLEFNAFVSGGATMESTLLQRRSMFALMKYWNVEIDILCGLVSNKNKM